MKNLKTNLISESLGLSLLLLASFYFYEFTYLSLPKFQEIVLGLLKIFIYLFLINLVVLKLIDYKYKNFFLFIFLIYILIFTIKLFFNASGLITLHVFLQNFYDFFIDYDPYNKPILLKIFSYLTPFLFVILILLFSYKKIENIKKLLSLFGMIVFFVMSYDLFEIYKSNLILKKNTYQFTNKKNDLNKKKVLWLLYDALDPEFLENENNKKKTFNTLVGLKNNGVYVSNAFSPGKFTNDSAPATLMGINILEARSKHRVKIFKDLNGNEIPFKFENTIFGKLKNLGLNVSLMSSVLEYCGSYLRSHKWTICKDRISENKNPSIFEDSLKFYFSFFFKLENFLTDLGIKKVDQKKIKNYKDLLRPTVTFDSLNFDALNQMEFNNSSFFSDQENIINVDGIIKALDLSDMTFLHIYNPHLHPDYNYFLFKNLNLKNDISEMYFLRYLYVDLFTKKIIEEIKKNNINNVLLIISSDHWWRKKVAAEDENYIGNSFFLAKNLDDNSSFLIEKPSSTIIIPNLIENYFKGNIFSNNNIYDYLDKSDIKIHVKTSR